MDRPPPFRYRFYTLCLGRHCPKRIQEVAPEPEAYPEMSASLVGIPAKTGVNRFAARVADWHAVPVTRFNCVNLGRQQGRTFPNAERPVGPSQNLPGIADGSDGTIDYSEKIRSERAHFCA
jgi:hypothetical protein